MSVVLLILALLLFVGLVVLHEFGHFIAARRNGVDVEEFGIGFPPRVWSRQTKSGYLFSINLLPLGGFVRLKGENDSSKVKNGFGLAKLSSKIKIMVAGVVMNLAAAFAIFTLLALIGMPKILDKQFTVSGDTKIIQEVRDKGSVLVGKVVDNSPASRAGLKVNDRIIKIADTEVTSQSILSQTTARLKGQTVEVFILRDNQELITKATLNDLSGSGQGYLGVASISGESGIELRRSSWSAPIVSAGIIGQFSELTYKGIGSALSGLFQGNTARASEQVSGPVGIFVLLKNGSTLGLNFVLMIIGVISLTLALMNILPIPALDGGRLFVTLLFRAIKRPLKKRTEERIHGTGFALLMILFVLITIVDIKRLH